MRLAVQLPFFLLGALWANAQNADSLFIRKIYDEALERGHSYVNLRSLCKDVGHRLTGSPGAVMAVRWGETLLKRYDFDTVFTQPFTAPHWVRGTTETAWITNAQGRRLKLDVLALGGTVGTNGLLEAEVIEVQGLDEVKKLSRSEVEGKVVFYNRPFDQKHINTFRAYGACVDQRWGGAMEAATLGAVAVVIRSMAQNNDNHPHTGSMGYNDSIVKIPAAALSTNHADSLGLWLSQGTVQLSLEMDCRTLPEVEAHNVLAQINGVDAQVITFGGHLDSWDAGEGAHDDGAGVIHAIEALRILKTLGYKPRHTLRAVLFMNEENGNNGGKAYARLAKEMGEQHLAAIESDRGGFTPEGFDVEGSPKQVDQVRSMAKVLSGFRLHRFQAGGSGVDIGPLKEAYPGILLMGMDISSQRYFDHHHAQTDVFENVNKRELELGSAAMAAMIYLIDKYYKP